MSDSLYTPDELLIVALRNKRDTTEALRLLTQEGADINAQNIRGETPLFMMSTMPGGQAAVEWLLANGANPNIPARTGDTPLMAAVKQNNPSMVAALLAGGADPNIANTRGVVPLLEAVLIPADKDRGLVQLFLEAAGLVPRSDEKSANPIRPAAIIDTGNALSNLMGQLDHVRPIAIVPSKGGAPYQAPDYSYAALHDGDHEPMGLLNGMFGAAQVIGVGPGGTQTVLSAGGNAGGPSKVHPSLISRPAHMDPVAGMSLNLDPRTDTQTTPLLAAVTRGQENIVRLLMNAGADAEAADHLGQGILYAAVLADNPGILHTIVSVAPWLNPNAAATSGTTPIAHAAVRGSKPELVQELLNIGGDPNARSRNRMAGVGSLLQGVAFQVEMGLPSVKARREMMKEAQKEQNNNLKEKKKQYQAALDANAAGNDMAMFAQLSAQGAVGPGTPLGSVPPGQVANPVGPGVGGIGSATSGGSVVGAGAAGPDWEALQNNPYWNGSIDLVAPEIEEIDMDAIFASLKEIRDEKNAPQLALIEAIIEKGGDASMRTESGQLAAPLGAVFVGAAAAMAIFAKHMKTGLDRPYDISCLTALDMFTGADLDHKDPASLEAMNNLIDLGVPVQRPHWDEAIDGPVPPLEGREAPKPRSSLPIHFYRTGWWEGLMCLLDRGGNVNEPDPLGVTLAHEMVADGSALPASVTNALALMSRQIIQKGGDPNTDEDYQEAQRQVTKEHTGQLNLQREKLNEAHINWAEPTRSGLTPLHLAVSRGDISWVDYLLEQPNVDPNAADEKGNSPVSLSLAHGDIRLFNKLVRATIARGLPDPTGDALLMAVQNAPDDFRAREPLRRAITLLGSVARLDRKAPHADVMAPVVAELQAHQAAVQAITDARQIARLSAKERAGKIKEAQKLASLAAKSNNLSPEDTRDAVREAGESAKAAQSVELEARLRAGEIIPGVSLVEVDAEREASLEHAQGHVQGTGLASGITTRLDKIDTSVTYRDPALDMAAPPPLVLAPLDLLGHQTNPAPGSFTAKARDARDADGHSALILAAACGQNDIVRVLLQEGFDPDAADKDGNTALMQAVFNEDGEVIRLLRAGGAKRDQQNAAGQTAGDVASYVKSVYVHNALIGGDLSGPLQDIVPPEATDIFQHDAWRAQLLLDMDNGLLSEEERRLATTIPWSKQIQAVDEALEKEEGMRRLTGQSTPAQADDVVGAVYAGDADEEHDAHKPKAASKATGRAKKDDLVGLHETEEAEDISAPAAKAPRAKRKPKGTPRSP